MASNQRTHTFYDRRTYMFKLNLPESDIYTDEHNARKWEVRGPFRGGRRVFYQNPFYRGRIGVRECANHALREGYTPAKIISPAGKDYTIRPEYGGSENEPVTIDDVRLKAPVEQASDSTVKAPTSTHNPEPAKVESGPIQAIADELLALSARLENLKPDAPMLDISKDDAAAARSLLASMGMPETAEGVALVCALRQALAGPFKAPQLLTLVYRIDTTD